MVCSKSVFNDLPELIYEIIQYLHNDHITLSSSFKRNQNKNLLPPIINTTLYNRSFLNDIDCFMMPEFDFIRRSEFNLPPISNLINFTTGSTQIQSPPQSIQLFQAVQSTQSQPTQSLQPQDITSLFKNGKKGLIYKLLFKLFIKYKANLHTFEIFLMKIKEYKYFNNVYDLILENPNFIRSIKNLKLAFYNKGTSNLPKIDSFITFLSSNCDSISTLYLQFQFRNNNNILIEKFSSQSIHILYCQFINSFIKQIVQITGPFKLRSLFLDKIVKLNSLNSLLQKSGNYLENFGLGTVSKDESKRQLLELIIKYCKNIQFFDLPEFDDQNNLYLALDLIKILDQNLNYLSIEFFELNLNSKKISSILLQELEGFDNILSLIEDYIVKMRKVKYLALKEDFIEGRDLFLLKDHVKKFDLYNIKVQSYNDLDAYNGYKHVKETYY
ncbi:hypothetical protein GLOIN_2v1774375 [Rhizophagus clarus]|uniref:F-box domain-containing protein n=1 Tax=Rhizophagus clarus TaxID=94130 RepID=A0A8H3L4B1_9GLOM|nr:hypothetical protein GLOIN_2v1774375 [Rhizophagus clarus]